MRLLFALFFVYTSLLSFAQNQVPQISNLFVAASSNFEATIYYDLADAENDAVKITLLVYSEDGTGALLSTENAIGDVGFSVMPGTNKTITWPVPAEGMFQMKLIADDLQGVDIQELVDQVDSNELRANLEFIVGARHRTSAPEHLAAIKDSLEQRFLRSNLETYRQDFPFGTYTGQNIIGRLEGTAKPDTTYIIDGHFDTVSNSPGADDNGSAVAGLLEVQRILAPHQFSKTLRFIGFDLEEAGLRGAIAYNATGIEANETIEGVFNLEMIGYYTNEPNTQMFPTGFELLYPDVYAEIEADEFRGNFISNIGDGNSVALQMAYDNAAIQYVPSLKVASIIAPPNWQSITPDLGRSDHAAFWNQGIPALMLTDGSEFRNPHYHSPNDLIETLDFTFMADVVKAVVAAVATEAEISHSSFVEGEISYIDAVHQPLDCGLRLSPVPTFDKLTLGFDNCVEEELTLQIFDIAGKLVLTQVVQPQLNSEMTISVNYLNSGVYWLNLSNGERNLSRKIIVE